ncbi:MAG: EAL domain-containing protein [Acetobacteraceae bacterium]|nr:EAL domain-containing protein [Acetobacteraceae bacterium]
MNRRPVRLTPDELARAIATEALVTRYQPKVRMSDRMPVGVETLARLRHPRLGLVGPEQFVPLAESAGLAPMLTAAVTRRAVADIAALRAEGVVLTVALNFPLEILELPEITDNLAEDVADGGLSPEDVIVELTESQVREDLAGVRRVTESLIARGFGVSLDDFGLGGAPHRHLHSLHFTEMKIDQGLVQGALTDATLAVALDTAVTIGRAMQLTVVAEGVETPPVWDMLRGMPVDQAQGWLVGRPMLAEEIASWARAWMAQ